MKTKLFFTALFCGLFSLLSSPAQAQEDFIGTIKLFAGNFPPVNYEFCHGQLLAINNHQVLFTILGTTYGGNGTTTFALPDLRNRLPIGANYHTLGANLGSETTTITTANLPSKSYPLRVYSGVGNTNDPNGNTLALGEHLDLTATQNNYTTLAPNTTLNSESVYSIDANQPLSTMPPTLGLNYIICISGIYPSRH